MELIETRLVKVAGLEFGGSVNRSASGGISHSPLPLPAGVGGTLDTRNSDTNGVCGLASGHGYVNGDKLDVYWVGTGNIRYNMAATVSGDNVTVDAGAGKVLPIATTVVVVSKRLEVDVDFDGDKIESIAIASNSRSHIWFITGADASIFPQEIVANELWSWVANQGVANPLAGAIIGKVQYSCGEVLAGEGHIGGLLRST